MDSSIWLLVESGAVITCTNVVATKASVVEDVGHVPLIELSDHVFAKALMVFFILNVMVSISSVVSVDGS